MVRVRCLTEGHRFSQFRKSGFTLLELIVVISLVGILSTVTLVKFSNRGVRDVTTQVDEFRRDIAHVQLLAMTWGVPLRLTFSSSGYVVTCLAAVSGTPCTAAGGIPVDPATGCSLSISLSTESACWTGLRVYNSTSINASASTVDFDSVGRPWEKVSGISSMIAYNPARTYVFSGSGKSVTVYLRPITGLAEAVY